MDRVAFAREVKKWDDTWANSYVDEFMGKELVVLAGVYPPVYCTKFYTEVAQIEVNRIIKEKGNCVFFEMGIGTGAMVLTIAETEGVEAYGVDVNPRAVFCTKANMAIRDVKAEILGSNLFDSVPLRKYDIIAWNIPFNSVDPGGIDDDVKYRASFDPGYKVLGRFLFAAKERISDSGIVLLGVDDRIHRCYPWKDKTLCGKAIRTKKMRPEFFNKYFHCGECDALEEKK